MMLRQPRKLRDVSSERQERLRYEVLERLYLLAGSCPGYIAAESDLETQLSFSLDGLATVVADLERLGYLTRSDDGTQLCITDHGLDYLRRGAWRRRSIRD
jgi:hypothetical protein